MAGDFWFVCTWCSCWCVSLFFFHLGFSFFLHILVIYCICSVFFFKTWWRTSTDLQDTQPPTLRGFCADAHRFKLKYWWVVGGVSWTFRDPPYESDFILVTQVRAIYNILPFEVVYNPVWELHTSAAPPPSLLFSVASTTNPVGHNIFTTFVDRQKNPNF